MSKEIQPYEQLSTYSCGSATLKLAWETLGLGYREEQLMVELQTDLNGTSWEDIFDHIKKTGFKVELKGNTTYKDLLRDQDKGLIILSWASEGEDCVDGHFGLLVRALPDMIELANPGLAVEDWPYILTKEEFEARWWEKEYLLLHKKK
jgi:ABC-type bacteriocin/lantibiotic exporter with double-glycine peptidase domain